MGEDFDAHRGEIANFENDLIDLCFEIVDASYDPMNAYYRTLPDKLEGRYAAPKEYVASLVAPTPYDFDNEHFHHVNYRRDIADLAQIELPNFLDSADLIQFDEINARLGRVIGHLDMASAYSGYAELITLLSHWQGEAAYNFEHKVAKDLGPALYLQLYFVDELGATAACLRQVIERGRGDALGIAQDLRSKVNLEPLTIPLETVLWIAASIAAGIATFGAAGAATAAVVASRIGLTIELLDGAITQVKNVSRSNETPDRIIEGDTAYKFIESCREQMQAVTDKGHEQVSALMCALGRDLGGKHYIDKMCISRPKILDGAEFELIDAENRSDGFKVESVADLRMAGVVTLPTMAEYFNRAYGEVANLNAAFEAAIGGAEVANTDRRPLTTAVETLAEAFKDTRDYLYEAGVALTDIADNYFKNEELQRAMWENFNTQLAEVDLERFPPYSPGSRSPSTDR